MPDPRLVSLQQSLPALRLETDLAELEHYGRDWTRRWTPAPLAVALPADVEQVQAIVRWAGANSVAIVPSGGRTGLSGGRSEEHTSELQSLMRNSYAAFCLKNKQKTRHHHSTSSCSLVQK